MGAQSLAPLLWFAAIIAAHSGRAVAARARRSARSSQGPLRSVAVLALSPNQRIVTVEVGRGDDRRWLVLGVTPQSITALHEMAPEPGPSRYAGGTAVREPARPAPATGECAC